MEFTIKELFDKNKKEQISRDILNNACCWVCY